MFRRFGCSIVALSLLVLASVGCGGGDSGNPSGTAPPVEKHIQKEGGKKKGAAGGSASVELEMPKDGFPPPPPNK